MVDWSAISATFTSLNVASTFVKNYLEQIKDDAVRDKLTEILNTIVPLYAQVLALYDSNLTLINERNTLEARLREIDNFAQETKEYEPNEITNGVIVYTKKADEKPAGPPLHLCPNCLNVHKKKSIIQFDHEDFGHNKHYFCPNCTFKFKIPPQTPPSMGRMAYQ